MKGAGGGAVEIVPYADGHGAAFRDLNLAWIRQHWEPEAADFKVLDHPRTAVIDQGGYIAIALLEEVAAGRSSCRHLCTDPHGRHQL